MGVSASLKAIHGDDLARISEDAGLVVPFLFGVPAESPEPAKPSFLSRLFGKNEAPPPIAQFHETPSVSLAGYWEVMTFALSGPNPPEDNPLDLVEGDFAAYTEVDLGYGPPRLIPPSRLAEFNRAITHLSDDDIGNRLNEQQLSEAKIYEKDQILENPTEWKAALIEKASELRAFARYCDEQQTAALVYFH